MQSAVDHFGQLNILVNNAGIRMYHTGAFPFFRSGFQQSPV